jgi:signal transduction histidine kinase
MAEEHNPSLQIETLRRLLDITIDLSQTLEMKELLSKMMDSSREICESEACSILLADRENNELVFEIACGEKGQEVMQLRIPLDENSIAGWVALHRTPLIVNDVSKDPRHCKKIDNAVHFTTRSILAIPVIAGDEIFGVIEAVNKLGPDGFTKRDKENLAIVASQAAIAIRNARLIMDLKSAREKLIRAEKLAMTGILASSVVHNIKGIVSVLKSPFCFLARDQSLNEDTRELVKEAECGVESLFLITKKLNSFSRPGELNKEPTNIKDLIESTLLMTASEATKRKVRIVPRLCEGLPPVIIDPGRIEQVFVNLILNAFEAMHPDGGILIIELSGTDGYAEMRFSDMGHGIPKEKMGRLFEPFFTTKPEGTGLGLFSCRQILEEEHTGKISVESEAGKGTTFTIRLPLTAPSC